MKLHLNLTGSSHPSARRQRLRFAICAALMSFSSLVDGTAAFECSPHDPLRSSMDNWMANGFVKPSKDSPLWELRFAIENALSDKDKRATNIPGLCAIWLGDKGHFQAANARSAFLDRLEKLAREISKENLIASGVPTEAAEMISDRLSRSWLVRMRSVGATREEFQFLLAKSTKDQMESIRRRALIRALRSTVTAAELSSFADGSSRSTSRGIQVATIGETQIAAALGDSSNVFSDGANFWLSKEVELKGEDIQIRFQSDARNLIAAEVKRGGTTLDALIREVRAGANQTTTEIASRAAELFQAGGSLGNSIKVLEREAQVAANSFDRLHGAVKQIHDDFSTAAKSFNLNRSGIDAEALAARDAAASGMNAAASKIGAVAALLSNGLSDRQSFGRAVVAIHSMGIDIPPTVDAAISAATALSNTSATVGSQISTVLSLASVVAPNEVKKIQSVLASAAPILSFGGPILAMTGFGVPAAALLSGGGLFGGGSSGPDAETMKQFAQINAKLDQIIDQLNRIEKEMALNHQQVMRSFDALGFDVRTIIWLNRQARLDPIDAPCSKAISIWQKTGRSHTKPNSVSSDRNTSERQDEECQSAIKDNAPIGTGAVLATYNVVTYLADSPGSSSRAEANLRWAAIEQAHPFVFRNSETWCGNLVIGDPSRADLVSLKTLGGGPLGSDDLCKRVADPANLIDPGTLTWVLNYKTRLVPLLAGTSRGKDPLGWHLELRLLNIAIAQQAGWAGLSNLEENSKWLYAGAVPSIYTDKQSTAALTALRPYQAFAENALRSGLYGTYGKSAGAKSTYAFAHTACDAYFLNAFNNPAEPFRAKGTSYPVLKGHFEVLGSTKADNVPEQPGAQCLPRRNSAPQAGKRALCLRSDALGICVPAPSPSELVGKKLRVPASLLELVRLRERILGLAEMEAIYGRLSDKDKPLLHELLTLQVMQEWYLRQTGEDISKPEEVKRSELAAWIKSQLRLSLH